MRSIFITFILLVISTSFNVNAKRTICDSCSVNQMKRQAEQMGDGLHTIFDTNSGSIKSFQVIIERDPNVPIHAVFETNVSNEVRRDFNHIMSAKASLEASLRNFQDNSNQVDSAWKLPGNHNNQSTIANRIIGNQTISDKTFNYISLLAALIGRPVSVNMTLNYTFADNSVATYAITGVDGSGQLLLNLVELRDANGQLIPVVLEQFQGTFTVSDTSGIGSAVSSFGGSMIVGGTTVHHGNGGPTVTCKLIEPGRYSCTATRGK